MIERKNQKTMEMNPSISRMLYDHRETAYPHSTLWINGRTVSIDRILSDREVAHSPFEGHTFSFIRGWLSGQEQFEMTTSGSTGTPKKISVTRSQMTVSALRTAEKLRLTGDMTSLVCIDTKYIGGKMMLVRSLVTGMDIMAVDPTANPLIRIPVDKCVQFTAFVPYQVASVLESKHPHLLNNLDTVLIGGAALNTSAVRALDRYQCECYETYGMTETVSHIALRLINTNRRQAYFETLPGVDIRLDERGCLVASTDYLTETVVTNDLVEIVGTGRFLWLGRWDSVINTGGVKVMPEKIEREIQKVFDEHHLPHRFFIAALPDERLGSKVVLIVEGVQISSELLNHAIAALKPAVSPFEFPREVYTIPEFHLTETQKIDRKKTLAGVNLLTSLK